MREAYHHPEDKDFKDEYTGMVLSREGVIACQERGDASSWELGRYSAGAKSMSKFESSRAVVLITTKVMRSVLSAEADLWLNNLILGMTTTSLRPRPQSKP